MNDEERQRQMDFILNQQAKFAADIQSLSEAQAQLTESQRRTDESLNKTIETLDRAVEALNRLTQMSVGSFQELGEKIAALDAKHAEMLAEMDERLNRMIIVVERHVSEGYHGRSQTE